MDLVTMQKFQAIMRSKKHQNHDNFFLCSLAVVTCSLLCSTPFWFPSLWSFLKVFLCVFLPKLTSVFFSSKFLFIAGNLIVVALIGQSKFFSSHSSPPRDVYYDEYISRSQSLRNSSTTLGEKKDRKMEISLEENVKKICENREKVVGEGWIEGKIKLEKEKEDIVEEDQHLNLGAEELNKRADDFIARVKKLRSLEAIN